MRIRRYTGLAALVVLVVLVIAAVTRPKGSPRGIPVGEKVPPFAMPLASGTLEGDANLATRRNDGEAGKRPACSVRGPEVLNVCELYEGAPVVLAFFVNSGECANVPRELQAVAAEHSDVRFAAVAIKGARSDLRNLIDTKHITIPVGYDRDGATSVEYDVATCPQVSFILPGGKVQAPALLGNTTTKLIRHRVRSLLTAAEARGWRPPKQEGGEGNGR